MGIYRVEQTATRYVHVLADDLKEAERIASDTSLFDDVRYEDDPPEVYPDDELGAFDYVWDGKDENWLAPEEAKAR